MLPISKLAPCEQLDFLKHQINNLLDKHPKPKYKLTLNERKAIQQLKNNKDITIVEADKGKAAVVIDKTEYQTLVDKSLNDETTYRQLTKDPTNSYEANHKLYLKNLRESKQLHKTLFDQLNPINCTAPYARATIKIHKNPIKICVLVCSRGSVYYNTARYLAQLLYPIAKTAKSYIKDSATFCQQLNETKTTSGQLISYDVVDLFTNVPRNKAIDALRSKVEEIKDTLRGSFERTFLFLMKK